MSLGSREISSSRTSAAFSNFPFLRNSAVSSLSLRTSTCCFLAIGVFLSLLAGRCLVWGGAGGPHAALGIGARQCLARERHGRVGGGGGRRTGFGPDVSVVAPQRRSHVQGGGRTGLLDGCRRRLPAGGRGDQRIRIGSKRRCHCLRTRRMQRAGGAQRAGDEVAAARLPIGLEE